MHVAVTGSHGLIGSALGDALATAGHRVTRVVRSRPGAGELHWDPVGAVIDADGLRGVDAVVHLAGESIASVRWTEEKKRRIRDSRVQGTRLLAETLAALPDGPRTLVCASGAHYYGDRGDEVLTEASGPGTGFLADVCRQWEAAADPAREAGVRVTHHRNGVVLHPRGGALRVQSPLFRLGLGGRLGSGEQYMSWLHLEEVVRILVHALESPGLVGPVNTAAPTPVTNAEFTRTLAGVLGRPALLSVPRLGPRLALGEMADELLFASLRMRPERLERDGYAFAYPQLEGALRQLLARPTG